MKNLNLKRGLAHTLTFKSRKKLVSGFTLIELLVVVAIIGILASVVLSSLGSARDKGADASIKANLQTIRSQATLYNLTNNSYGVYSYEAICSTTPVANMLSDPIINAAIVEANAKTGGTVGATYSLVRCAVSPSSYAIAIRLKSDTTRAWCVDSSGSVKETTGNLMNFNLIIMGSGPVGDPYICGV